MSLSGVASPNSDAVFTDLRSFPIAGVVSERRQSRRYPIAVRSEYLVGKQREQATSANISSAGILLKTDKLIPVGQAIEVLIDWPVLLDGRSPLRFVVSGIVLRSDGMGTAVGIKRYEFRMRAHRTAQSPD